MWTLLLILLAALAVLNFLDVISTVAALKKPGVYEANIFVAWLQKVLGKNWWVIKPVGFALIAIIALSYGPQAPVIIATSLMVLGYIYVVQSNLKLAGWIT